jgi:hypothetical protein
MFFDDEYDDEPREFQDEEGQEEEEEQEVQQPMEEEDEGDEISTELWQEACWVVISAYFDEKGLVRQQLDRFFFTEALHLGIKNLTASMNSSK